MDEVRLSIELYKEGDKFGAFMASTGGWDSGITVEGATPEECAENLAPYIADYFYKNEED